MALSERVLVTSEPWVTGTAWEYETHGCGEAAWPPSLAQGM